MALAMRLARGGRKSRPFYRIVVADKRMPRDGRYIERLGTYNPQLANDDEKRVVLNEERIKYWLGEGAKPSTRVHKFLGQAGILDMPTWNETPQKSAPSEKTVERKREKEEKLKAAQEAAAEAAATPAEEAPAEESAETSAEDAATEAPAEEAKTEDAPAEEAPAAEKAEEKAEDAPAEETAEEEKKDA